MFSLLISPSFSDRCLAVAVAELYVTVFDLLMNENENDVMYTEYE